MFWWCALALAGPIEETFPRAATVQLPRDGVVLVEVPASLRSPDDPADGRDLLLLDAEGRAVPFAVLTGDTPPEFVRARRGTVATPGELVVWPDTGRDAYWVKVDERPLDGLSVRLPHTVWAATVVIEEQTADGLVETARRRVWRLDDLDDLVVPLPPRLGTYRATLTMRRGDKVREAELVGVRYEEPPLPPSSWTLPVRGQLQDSGIMRYDLPLPVPQPIDWVAPITTSDLFEASADVVTAPPYADTPTTLPPQLHVQDPHRIRRVDLGGAAIDDVRVPVTRTDLRDGADLALLVDLTGREPIDVVEVEVGVGPKVLVVRNAGPGPHTLLGGAQGSEGATLQFAARELLRAADTTVVPTDLRANPAFVPMEVRSQVAGPGRTIDLEGMRFQRSLEGQGLARVPLDAHVLTQARSDLGDLRVVDDEGRQLPYLLRRSVAVEGASDLPMERTERGEDSHIAVQLPERNLFVSTLTVHSSAPVFDRTVTVSKPVNGRPADVLRKVSWNGLRRPGSLGIGLHRRVGDELLVTIDNGDDPPLPVERIDVTWEGWELMVVLPDAGATLLYGDRQRSAPSYDFASLEALGRRTVPAAEVGEPSPATRPARSFLERLLVFAGLGVLALGLLALTGLLIRGAPPEPEPEEPGGETEE